MLDLGQRQTEITRHRGLGQHAPAQIESGAQMRVGAQRVAPASIGIALAAVMSLTLAGVTAK